MDELTKRLEVIEKRNHHKDLDKAWERSWTRKMFIALATYIFAAGYLYWIKASTPLLSAIVPSAGFVLSHLSLKQVEDLWLKHVKKEQK
jgi:hypothetical protein